MPRSFNVLKTSYTYINVIAAACTVTNDLQCALLRHKGIFCKNNSYQASMSSLQFLYTQKSKTFQHYTVLMLTFHLVDQHKQLGNMQTYFF